MGCFLLVYRDTTINIVPDMTKRPPCFTHYGECLRYCPGERIPDIEGVENYCIRNREGYQFCKFYHCPPADCGMKKKDVYGKCYYCPGTCIEGGMIFQNGQAFYSFDMTNYCFCGEDNSKHCTKHHVVDQYTFCNHAPPDTDSYKHEQKPTANSINNIHIKLPPVIQKPTANPINSIHIELPPVIQKKQVPDKKDSTMQEVQQQTTPSHMNQTLLSEHLFTNQTLSPEHLFTNQTLSPENPQTKQISTTKIPVTQNIKEHSQQNLPHYYKQSLSQLYYHDIPLSLSPQAQNTRITTTTPLPKPTIWRQKQPPYDNKLYMDVTTRQPHPSLYYHPQTTPPPIQPTAPHVFNYVHQESYRQPEPANQPLAQYPYNHHGNQHGNETLYHQNQYDVYVESARRQVPQPPFPAHYYVTVQPVNLPQNGPPAYGIAEQPYLHLPYNPNSHQTNTLSHYDPNTHQTNEHPPYDPSLHHKNVNPTYDPNILQTNTNTHQWYDPNIHQPYDPNKHQPYDPNKHQPYDPNTPQPYDPNKHQPYDPNTPQPYDPNIHQPYDPNKHSPHDPNIHQSYDPNKHQPYDPNTPQPYDPNIHQPYDPNIHQPYDPNKHLPYDPNKHQLYGPNIHQPHDPNAHQPYDPNEHQPYDPNKHLPYDPNIHQPYDPNKHQPHDPNKHQPYDPNKHQPYYPNRHLPYDPNTHPLYDPNLHLSYDPNTPQPYDPNSQQPNHQHGSFYYPYGPSSMQGGSPSVGSHLQYFNYNTENNRPRPITPARNNPEKQQTHMSDNFYQPPIQHNSAPIYHNQQNSQQIKPAAHGTYYQQPPYPNPYYDPSQHWQGHVNSANQHNSGFGGNHHYPYYNMYGYFTTPATVQKAEVELR